MTTPTRAIAHTLGAATLSLALLATAHADIVISEVAPWSSGNSAVAADWFELTNTGSSAVAIGGWRVDDNSNSFASSVALAGITSIAAGESVIFIEGTGNALFLSNWFGSSAPAGLQVGSYSGAGIGLGAGGDALNVYTTAGALVTRVDFGASPTAAPFATFDNAAGLSGTVTLTTLSAVGVRGGFLAASGSEIGSPGRGSAVPEPASVALLLAGLGLVAGVARRRG